MRVFVCVCAHARARAHVAHDFPAVLPPGRPSWRRPACAPVRAARRGWMKAGASLREVLRLRRRSKRVYAGGGSERLGRMRLERERVHLNFEISPVHVFREITESSSPTPPLPPGRRQQRQAGSSGGGGGGGGGGAS